MALPLRTWASLRPSADRRVVVRSEQMDRHDGVAEYRLGGEAPGRGWLDYVQGVTWALRDAGYGIGGFDAAISSSVPMGSGLASSAALEVSLLRALRAAFGLDLDDVQLALLGQRAENEFVGARVGIMDQMAASLAQVGSALFLDTRSLEYRHVRLPSGVDVLVLDSGIRHSHAAGEYNARRAECERACELLGVRELRDIGPSELDRVEALPEPLCRRARHVVTENERVLAAVDAMQAGHLKRLGDLFNASHASMRDDYEVSVSGADALVALAQAEADVYGARLTGGGFGGAIVALVRQDAARAVGNRVARTYSERTGRLCRVLLPQQ
jgi:galactokinase